MKKLIALKHKLDEMKAMGTNAKKEALANMDDFEQSMVSLMLNPFIRFGVKKYKVAEPLSESVPSDEKAIDILNKLASRELTRNAAIAAVESIVASMCADGQDVFRRFLLKDPKAGVGISLCNKVFENPIPKFEVQLASPYKEKGDKYPFKPNPKAKWPMIGSLKLDGLRVICEVIVDEEEVNFLSRTGNPITSLDHLKPAMLELGKLSGHKHIFFDGEGTAGSFNQSVSALRKKNVQAIGAIYHVFDFFLPEWRAQAKSKEYAKTGMKLKERLTMLVALFKNDRSEGYAQDIHLHPFYIIHSHEDFIERFMKRLDDNEEGEMGKDPNSGFANTLGKIVIRLENGVIVRASGIKHKYLDEIWNNKEKYRGRIVEVHCHEKTPDGSLRHPRLKWPRCLRDTEDRIGDKE
ncbi:ATP-dependent DNA ligase [Escherichia coli]|uniref:ATP-dependent DNA ligase n=1 Tax=Escherichia coli TaxID=562 RepID=UPI0010CBC212|nr:DNA ligase [Escherichia coli]GDA53366.1 hypothetical protein HmCmsJML164_03847 [Escherichia coli]